MRVKVLKSLKAVGGAARRAWRQVKRWSSPACDPREGGKPAAGYLDRQGAT